MLEDICIDQMKMLYQIEFKSCEMRIVSDDITEGGKMQVTH